MMASSAEIKAACEMIGREMMPWSLHFRVQVRWPHDYSDDERHRIQTAAIFALEAAERVRKPPSEQTPDSNPERE